MPQRIQRINSILMMYVNRHNSINLCIISIRGIFWVFSETKYIVFPLGRGAAAWEHMGVPREHFTVPLGRGAAAWEHMGVPREHLSAPRKNLK
jgi:hypothetical protein